MHHAKAHELRLLEPRDHAEHARLIAPLDLRLKSHQREVIAGKVVLTQLRGRIGESSGARIDETDRFHRTEAQRVAATMRHHLERQAAFEELRLVEVVHRRGFSGHKGVVERVVLGLVERTVQIVPLILEGWLVG